MRIYSNKKRPVKASDGGRKWVNTEVSKAEWNKLRKFLKANGYKFEPSEAGSMVHVECYLNGEEIKEVNDFIDTLDDVKSACGKKSVKSSTRRKAVKADNFLRSTRKSDDGTFSYTIDENRLYYGVPGAYFIWKGEWGDPWVEYEGSVYSAADLDDGVYADFSEYCKENGLTFADWREEDAAFDEWAKEYGKDSAEGWLYDMSPFAEVVETSGNYHWAKEIGDVNASTKRRGRRSVKASRTIEILTYDELTPEQKQYVIDNWSNMSKLAEVIYEWHGEDEMLIWKEESQFIADRYASQYGLSINPDKIYWQSNSQGPYPEWDLSQVFDEYQLNDGTEIYFYGSGLDVETETDSWGEEVESPEIDEVVGHAQQFIDEIWSLINNICQSYPDDEWAQESMESNPDAFEFTIGADGNPKYY